MNKDNENDVTFAMGSRDVLTEILRSGARKMRIDAIEDEVNTYLEQHANERDEQNHRPSFVTVSAKDERLRPALG